MECVTKHLGFIRHLGDFRFKHWLDRNASNTLADMGVGTSQVVLDFGCGSGTYTIPAAKLVGEHGRVYALDLDLKSLDRMEEKARKKGLKNITRISSTKGGEIPLEDGSVDLMLLLDVLQEIDDWNALFDEANRILKPNGLVTVYPMHTNAEKIESLAKSKGLSSEEKRVQGRILRFKKA